MRDYFKKNHTQVAFVPVGVGFRNRRDEDGTLSRRFETHGQPKANALTTVQTDSMVAEPLNVTEDGKAQCLRATYYKDGMNLVLVDGGKYKDMIASRLRKPNGKGSWMVYKGCDEEYAKEVTAEHKVAVKNGKGQQALVWQPKGGAAGKDNHYLDCEVYCMAAADVKGVRNLFLQTAEPPKPQPTQAQPAPAPEEDWIRANDNWL